MARRLFIVPAALDPPSPHRRTHRVALAHRPPREAVAVRQVPVRPARAGRRGVPGVWGADRGAHQMTAVLASHILDAIRDSHLRRT